jgi:hypothetical protein
MGNNSKKPDQVVYNEDTNKYEAGLLPYATNSSAPKITPTDLTGWKNSNVSKVNHQIKTEYEELKQKYEKLMAQYEYNNLIYSAEFSFEPIVGEIYHLYENKNGKIFLSIISPNECNFDFKGSFKLNEDKMWVRLDSKGKLTITH